MFLNLLVCGALLAPPPTPPAIGNNNGSSSAPPPAVVLAGGRSVAVRNATGGLQRFTSIPRSSAFSTYGGGARATCTFTADRDGFRLSNGDIVDRGTVVTSAYLFVEGLFQQFDIPPEDLPADVTGLGSLGSLETAVRTFTVYCDGTYYDINQSGTVQVPFRDSLFDPVSRLDELRNDLQLERPTVFTNPIVDEYGGLVTRYPTWLAIADSAWRTQRGDPVVYRGATLLLIAQPRELSFVVDFVPNPDKPSPAFRGVVGCVPNPGIDAAGDVGAVIPPLPVLPDQTEPGVNGPCMWTPPGPGTVTITAQITYSITFWVNGYTLPDDDYVWSSAPTEFDTGELIAVNTKP